MGNRLSGRGQSTEVVSLGVVVRAEAGEKGFGPITHSLVGYGETSIRFQDARKKKTLGTF